MTRVSYNGWELKKAKLNAIVNSSAIKAVQFGSDEIYKATAKNLSGPHFKEGNVPAGAPIPIRRITSMLAQSLTQKRLTPYLTAIFSDVNIAPYNQMVHDGTRYMRPRRFLGDPVRERRQAILNVFKRNVLRDVRKVGQKIG